MSRFKGPTRRSLLIAGGAVFAAGLCPPLARAAAVGFETTLVAHKGQVALTRVAQKATDVWCYGGSIPGPEIRVRQGDRVRITLDNRLPQDTTVHWHGVRVPNAMDGAPGVTQALVQPGQRFVYDFPVPDAGTYWYHPHAHSAEQVGRGLMGAFIIEEPEPLPVDRDLAWVLGDFRLKDDGAIDGGFDNPMEMSMSGRVGNTVTINGHVPEAVAVRAGERIRLRLINAAAARIFALEFKGLNPLVIAVDGQPIAPHAPEGGRITLGPAMRADLLLDMSGNPGIRTPVRDSFYQGLEYKLVDLAYDNRPPLRAAPLPVPPTLPPNPIPQPGLDAAQRHQVTLTGGMMGGMAGGMAMGVGGGGAMWAINGVAMTGGAMGHMEPVLRLDLGKSYILALDNQTAWHHPIHLHGHSFRVISRNGARPRYAECRDTVLMAPRDRVEIAFVADNPGDWMFHCHILAHQEGGMMSVIRVV